MTESFWAGYLQQEQRGLFIRDRFNLVFATIPPSTSSSFHAVYETIFNPNHSQPLKNNAYGQKRPHQEVIVSKATRMTAQMRTAYKITKQAHLLMAQGRKMPFLVRTLRICKTLQRSKVTGEWSLERVL